ncbi:MAG: deoxyribodipyrimidine photo-lyase, partial [Planctomycetota bacterium]|nr:deoxyribodipyrimidine photo-lyase [Planctomycetota bacterium]
MSTDSHCLSDALPPHLQERTRWIPANCDRNPHPVEEGFVLYWMRTAVRTDENPALDAARWLAHHRGLKLLIYHAVSERYRYASDRHHLFMLQGGQDVQRQFSERGMTYAFHLATHRDRRPHLTTLAAAATFLVTEEMPTDPGRFFLRALMRGKHPPIASVDTACIAPMHQMKKACTRAFEFRSTAKRFYQETLAADRPDIDFDCHSVDLKKLTLEPRNQQ